MKNKLFYAVLIFFVILSGTLPTAALPAPGDKWDWESIPKYKEFEDYPSKQNKWKSGADDEKRDKYLTFIQNLRNEDPKTIKALPAAEDFPGLPLEGTPVISQKITITPNHKGWHSTGLYAMPGVPFTVKIPKNIVESQNFEILIGCHKDRLGPNHKDWSRSPELVFPKKIESETTTACNPFGGLIYINVPSVDDNSNVRPVELEISPIVKAPSYIMGKTSLPHWKKGLGQSGAPWGEIVTPRLIVSMPYEQMTQSNDIQKAAKALHAGMTRQDWLAGWDKTPERLIQPMRFVTDRQPGSGAGHSGYPAIGGYSFTAPIATGDIYKTGMWGFWHELGHNHQRDPWRMNGLGEVAVNLYTVISQNKITGVSPEKAWNAFSFPSFPKDLDAFFNSELTYDDINNKHVVKLAFFTEIMGAFGFEPFRNASIKYNKNPYKKLTNQEKWDWIMISFSEDTKKNLGPYFQNWKIDISPEALKKTKKYPVWLPNKGSIEKYMKKTS